MRAFTGNKPTLMSKKFYSMLLGGTLTMTVVSLLLMSDSIIAGIFVGEDAVAGVTLVTPMYSLAAFFGSLFSIGVPIVYTTEMGRFNKEKADQSFGFGILISIVIGVGLFVLVTAFGSSYLSSGSVTPEILSQAKDYLFWMRFTILVMPMQMLLGALVYCDGDEIISTVASGVQGLGNIVFSVILSQSMGVKGIGLASFLFIVVSMLIYLLHFLRKSNSLRFNIYFSFSMLKDVARFGIIDSSSYLFLAAFTGFLNMYILNHFGSKFLIIVSTVTLCREFQLVYEGIGGALSPPLSVYAGEHSKEGLRSIYKLGNKTAIIEGIIVSVVLIIAAPFFPSLLDVSSPDLIFWVKVTVCVTALGSTFVSLLYLITSYYLIIEQILLGVVACAMRDVLFSVTLVFVFAGLWDIYGLCIGLFAAPIVAYSALRLFLKLRYGNDSPLLLNKVYGDEENYLYNLSTDPEDIIRVQHEVETLLKENNIDSKTINRVLLLIEEMNLFIRTMNEDKAVLAECSIFIRPEGIQIISKDGGVPFDMADEDLSIKSLSAYTVASYLEKRDFGNRHLTTMSFNRSSFLVKYE